MVRTMKKIIKQRRGVENVGEEKYHFEFKVRWSE